MLRPLGELEHAFAEARARVVAARAELKAIRDKLEAADIAEREAYGETRQILGELIAHPSLPPMRAMLLRASNGGT